ncbi:hypothetical protein E4T52_13420 [Aureobasidium sp. EXF-3400]|nr:hypothetical protein E4T52_13420 [Aureobasidium sp. EXF-3400]
MKLEAVFLAFGLVTLVRGQVGPDGYTTVTTATCTTTGVNIYAYTDTSAIPYNYMCGGGSGGTALTTVASASVSRWQDCFSYCDTYIGTVGCTGFTFNQGANLGNGPGQCILKGGTQSFASTTALITTRIAGLNARYLARPSPTFSCPQQDQQTLTDTYGGVYQIACGNDTTGSSPNSMVSQAPNGFNDCFGLCDNYTPPATETYYTTCNAFVYVGKSNGVGAGNCYLNTRCNNEQLVDCVHIYNDTSTGLRNLAFFKFRKFLKFFKFSFVLGLLKSEQFNFFEFVKFNIFEFVIFGIFEFVKFNIFEFVVFWIFVNVVYSQ